MTHLRHQKVIKFTRSLIYTLKTVERTDTSRKQHVLLLSEPFPSQNHEAGVSPHPPIGRNVCTAATYSTKYQLISKNEK